MNERTTRSPLLGELDAERFLRDHWQRKPLLVRGALPGLDAMLGPNELAGLATEPEAIARLVLAPAADGTRELRHGPFDADELAGMADRDWTLLVQEVDRHVEPVAAALAHVRFLPNWRIDDVMVSFAAAGGGVGPHVDRYDVFLIQAGGRRRWSIEDRPRTPSPGPSARALTDRSAALHPLENFEPTESWDLEPGDVLYLPPGFAHDGIALDACMTWSIGFRAPTAAEFCAGVLETAGDTLRARRYVDPPLTARGDDPGRIAPAELEAGRELLIDVLRDDELWLRAMGRASTLPVRRTAGSDEGEWSADELRQALADGARLDRRAIGELAWAPGGDGRALLFASGELLELPVHGASWARLLCGTGPLDATSVRPLLDDRDAVAVLTELLARGTLIVID